MANRDKPRFALWLLPPLPWRDRLATLIDDLARRYGTLRFAPHITLVSGLTGEEGVLAEKAQALARVLEPFEVHLGTIDCGSAYSRSIFARTEAVVSFSHLHRQASAVFDIPADPDYQPHLSLLYGEPRDTAKEDVVQVLGGGFDIAFCVAQMALYRTSGGPAAWKCVREYFLGRD